MDVLQDLQTKEEMKQRCKCIKKAKILEASDDDSDEIDELHIRLNLYMARQKKAWDDWKKLKFRLLIISKFSSYRALTKVI